jgi:hypothetical protein
MKSDSISWPEYIRFGIGRRLSMLGERLGVNWLTYNPIIFRQFHNLGVASAPGVVDSILAAFPHVKHVADVGAGTGVYAAEFKRRGIQTSACEYNRTGRRWALRQGVESVPFDLSNDPPAVLSGDIDLSYCFEVAEHLPPAIGAKLVKFISGLSPIVVFTAAHPGQGGTGHINEQPKQYWIDLFADNGLIHLLEESNSLANGFRARANRSAWLAENVIALRRAG